MNDDTAKRYFLTAPDELRKERFRFDPEEEHHMIRVLRLREGTLLQAVDGVGNGAVVRLEIEDGGIIGQVVERYRSTVEPELRLTVAVGIAKGRVMDGVVERCTELGAAAFLPFISERAVPRWNTSETKKQIDRWVRIARAAMKVSHGALLPEINPPSLFKEVVGKIAGFDTTLLLSREGERFVPRTGALKSILTIIGPEGGLTLPEERLAIESGARRVSLGPRNMKTGTAATVVSARLLTFGDDIPQPGLPGKGTDPNFS